MKKDIVLKVSDIHKEYKSGPSTSLHVLKGISMEVHEGEIISIIGPSGVGKSTFLHIIGALDRPTSGQFEIDGVDPFTFNDTNLATFRNKTVGFVYQFHHLLPEFTALENIMMPGRIAGKDKNELKKKGLELLEKVGLKERAHHKPNELSGGEQQRIAVARAIVNQPRLLLADEPSGNLDLHTAEALHNLLWDLSREHKQTLIVVTHNPELADRSDRIIELYDGQIKNEINKTSSSVVN